MKSITTQSPDGYQRIASRHLFRKSLIMTIVLSALLLTSTSIALAQVYGVSRHTAVVHGPNRTVVASKTTVGGGVGLPHGYIAALPGGYRSIYVHGVRYYTVGGVYYRPQIYGGRTVYVVAHI